ncbi:MAG: glycosyltransferase family 2 protein [Fidelibacterota bacterium]|nr:MAG: glycosyltransferase family 2 protein [Candidatus Neomarinimicrobiota bacterium]
MNPSTTDQTPPTFSVVIANYNGLAFLKTCFDSLNKSTYPSIEIIMVDNGSTDESVSFVEENYPSVQIVKSPINLSYSGGNNLGMRQARGKYIVLLNNDTEVTPGWLEPLLEELESDKQIAACQPKILNMRDRKAFEYAGAAGGFMDRLAYPFLRGRIFDTVEEDHHQYQTPVDLFWTSGAAMAIRKDVLDEAGFLDEDFVLHMEEIDLCWRLHLLGYRMRARPDAVIYHYGGGTLGREKTAKMYYNHRNSVFMLLKNYTFRSIVKVLPKRLLLDLALIIKSLLTLDLKRATAVAGAYLWLLFHVNLINIKHREVQRLRRVGDKEVDKFLYPRSVALAYYIRRKKTFSEIWDQRA